MTPGRTHLPSITTLHACSKAEIQNMCLKCEPLLPGAESSKRDKIKIICLQMSDVRYCLILAS